MMSVFERFDTTFFVKEHVEVNLLQIRFLLDHPYTLMNKAKTFHYSSSLTLVRQKIKRKQKPDRFVCMI